MRVLVVSADRSDERGMPRNLGDALLTDALVGALREQGLDAAALDLGGVARAQDDAQARAATAPRVVTRGLRGMAAAIADSDAVVLGGGTLFADDQPHAPFAGLPRLCLTAAGLARLRRLRFASFGVGVDPMARGRARAAIRFAARSGPVWVRDAPSAERVAALGGGVPHVAADVALLGRATVAGLAAAGVVAGAPSAARDAPRDAALDVDAPDSTREGAVVALNRVEAALLRPDDIRALEVAHGPVRFVSMHQGEDADADALSPDARRALAAPPAAALSWPDAARAIASSRVVVASRMHAMYLGAMTGTPIAALAPTPKTRAFADEFGVPVVTRVADAAHSSGRADAAALDLAATRGADALERLDAWLRS